MLTLKRWPCVFALLICCVLIKTVESKIYERCELAKILRQRHGLGIQEVAQWVCIAEHSSGFNTGAQAYSSAGGSHGLFQISDVYWCSPPGTVSGCNVPCHKLRDDNLTDDLSCVKRIYAEHQRISGDGYTAWNSYQQYCKNNAASYIEGCFPAETKGSTHLIPSKGYNSYNSQNSGNSIEDHSGKKRGKIYGKCELARELYHKHKMPMEQVPTWVCIAEHESRFNTAAVGRLNTDGSADHGLFQISDIYWCAHNRYSGGKACGLSCNKLLDDDITDDVRCVKRIHTEHTAISGDGFNAWTVYKPFCQNQHYNKVSSCFANSLQSSTKGSSNAVGFTKHHGTQQHQKNPFFKQQTSSPSYYQSPKHNDVYKSSGSSYSSSGRISSHKGKIYTRCSLAQELYFKYNFPMQDIATWVCIAEHESQLNTAAIGRLNTDGSADHGLFQISDRYWCTHDSYGGKACNMPCDKLVDEDLKDDIRCIKIIHEEHTRISGNGFNAWTVYQPHCTQQNIEHIKQCFDEKDLAANEVQYHNPSNDVNPSKGKGKIYKKCELAQELYHQHQMSIDQIPKWVCIAQHESSFNTAAVGRLNTDGSADHGLFQISDLYWCTHTQYGGKACNIPCDKLLDSDISDDVKCIKIIHEEHTRISGDGFNAWTVYKPHCRNIGMDHIKTCFTEKELKESHENLPVNNNSLQPRYPQTPSKGKGKIYKKCELAQELHHQHQMPMDQIPKWVCIAQHESSFNTAAVGRLNTDGSADHGLFQISDLYWCTHNQYGGKACNIPCDKLLDSDISDDVKCIKIIHEEHTRISGDGFNAWTVYKPHCRNIGMDHIKSCFSEKELKDTHKTPINNNSIQPQYPQTPSRSKGKIYKKCELAQELLSRHEMPMEQIPTWVCIAQYESSFNTAAVGRLNTDGSADHGLFQISDLYWCTHDQYGGKACNIPCDKLLDSDISDDVKCIKIIHEEHTRISGDGFNAWTVYKPHCRNRKMEDIRSCFKGNEIHDYEKKFIIPAKPVAASKPVVAGQPQGIYNHNPFLSGFSLKPQPTTTQKPFSNPHSKISADNEKQNYANNPFLQNSKTHKFSTQNQMPNYNNNPFLQPSKSEIFNSEAQILNNDHNYNYNHNPFLNNKLKPAASAQNLAPSTKPQAFTDNKLPLNYEAEEITSKPSYNKNPFLNGSYRPASVNSTQNKPSEAIRVDSFNSNPFLNGNIKFSDTEKPSKASLSYEFNPFLQNLPTPSPTKNYLNSNQFRTTTKKPNTSTTLKSTTTWNSLTNQKSTTSWTTTTKPNYLNSNQFRITTRKPITYTTLKIATTWNSLNAQKSNTLWTTTTKPITTTTRKTTTTLKTTTKKPITTSWTTKTPKITTTWNWQKFANSTTKPITIQSTPTKSPKTTTTWSWKSTKYTNPSTTQLLTTKSPKTATTLNWQNQKYANPTTKPATIRTTTAKIPKSTTGRTTTTWSWQNQQYAKSTTKPITDWASTTKLPKTTKTATTWNWQNQIYSNTTTTKTPKMTTKLYSTTKRAATTKNTTRPSSLHKTTTNWNAFTTKLQMSTTKKPEKTTWNWRNDQQTKTTKTPTTATSIVTTSKKTITTKNWRIYDKTTHAPSTTKKTLTTKPTFKTTSNWFNSTLKATTTKPPTTTTKRITTTTKTPTTKTFIQQTLKPTKPTTTLTTKPQITTALKKENHKTTTLNPVTTKTSKPQNTRPSTRKSVLQKTLTTTKSYITTTLKPTIADSEKFRKDPFSHPFFAKVNEEISRLKGNTTTTKLPLFKAIKLQSFNDSPYYQDYKNSKGNNTKTIVSYNFNQATTTKRPRL